MHLRFAACWLSIAGVLSAASLETPSSAEFCGRCHRAILDAWKTSAHARAMESPLFQDALGMAETEFGAGATRMCLDCHSPVGVLTGDRALRQKVSWEGITCDYCHSIRDISLGGTNPRVKVEFSLVKSGPLKDIQAPAHEAIFSPLHTSSVACAPCHEYRNSLGLPVLTTFSEWKDSRYAKEGKACQSCHMYEVAGDVVDPKIRKSAQAKVNLHQMPGGHSITQLNKTVKMRLSSIRENDQLKVSVEVSNVAAGHYVPTGSPMRQLVLEVQADPYNGAHFRQERRYQRTVADRQGAVVAREHVAFFNGAKVLSDTRLAPDETRTEAFSFPVPSGVAVQLKATLWYYYSPLARNEAEQRVTFNSITRLVR